MPFQTDTCRRRSRHLAISALDYTAAIGRECRDQIGLGRRRHAEGHPGSPILVDLGRVAGLATMSLAAATRATAAHTVRPSCALFAACIFVAGVLAVMGPVMLLVPSAFARFACLRRGRAESSCLLSP